MLTPAAGLLWTCACVRACVRAACSLPCACTVLIALCTRACTLLLDLCVRVDMRATCAHEVMKFMQATQPTATKHCQPRVLMRGDWADCAVPTPLAVPACAVPQCSSNSSGSSNLCSPSLRSSSLHLFEQEEPRCNSFPMIVIDPFMIAHFHSVGILTPFHTLAAEVSALHFLDWHSEHHFWILCAYTAGNSQAARRSQNGLAHLSDSASAPRHALPRGQPWLVSPEPPATRVLGWTVQG